MSKERILIASLLKPINDTRMFEKLGISLSKLPDTQIHIVGFQAPAPNAPATISFHPIFHFRRLGSGRLLAQRQYSQLLEELRPDLIIATTHELLPASQRFCARYGARLLYDVQENYALNLTSQQNYPPLLRQLLAFGVRRNEQKAAPAVSHFLLAERSYADELPFLRQGKYSFIENKFQPDAAYTLPATPVTLHREPLRILYSGTIAPAYGIFEAVDLAEAMHHLDPGTTFTIIGYSARKQTLLRLRQRIKNKAFIRFIGGDTLVPYGQILEEVKRSNLGLLPYQPNPSTERCIPTKLYEYMAHALPVLVQRNPLWQSLVEQHQAGFAIDFRHVKPQELLSRIRQKHFYTAGVPQDVFWRSEEEKLLPIVQQLLKQRL